MAFVRDAEIHIRTECVRLAVSSGDPTPEKYHEIYNFITGRESERSEELEDLPCDEVSYKIANAAVEKNTNADGSLKYGSAFGYACAIEAIKIVQNGGLPEDAC